MNKHRMNKHRWMLMVAVMAVAACADADTDGADAGADSAGAMAAGGADTADAMAMDNDMDSAGVPEAGLLNVNTAAVADLRAAGLSDAAAAAITTARPFDDMLEVDSVLATVLDSAGREAAYRVMWIPFDLNAVTREEILLIPGVGDRMAGEFEEYRPYTGMAEFRREIGKYVDDAEVERLAQYVKVE